MRGFIETLTDFDPDVLRLSRHDELLKDFWSQEGGCSNDTGELAKATRNRRNVAEEAGLFGKESGSGQFIAKYCFHFCRLQELETAKKHGTQNKRMALQALRRKKQNEKQLGQIDGVLNTLQHQKDSLENASVNAEVLQVLGSTSKALKSAHNNMDIDQVVFDCY